MKKSRYTDRQIMALRKQAQAGTPVPELCREHGMSSATFYKWRAKYGGMDASMMARLKALEEENRRLKKRYAKERLKAEIVQEALQKKVIKPSLLREVARQAVQQRAVSIRLACSAVGISETCYRYQLRLTSWWNLRASTTLGRWTLCTISSQTAGASELSTGSMTVSGKAYAWKWTSRCRQSVLNAPWIR